MELSATYYDGSLAPGDTDSGHLSVTLNSPNGCQIELNTSVDYIGSSGGSWSNAKTIKLPSSCGDYSPNRSNTSVCGDREVISIRSHFDTNQTNRFLAQLCAPSYFVAYNVTTIVSNSLTGSLFSIDEILNWTMLDLDFPFIDLLSFEAQFLDSEWENYYHPADNVQFCQTSTLDGPLRLLAATIIDPVSDPGPLVDAAGLLDQARRVKQRFFREALQAVFVSVGKKNAHKIVAQVRATKTRLLVEHWIGISLGVILLASAAIIALAFYCSRLRRRPLNLDQDPGSTAAVVAMMCPDAPIGSCFRGLDRLPEHSMKTMIGTTMFGMVKGQLVVKCDERAPARDGLSLAHPDI